MARRSSQQWAQLVVRWKRSGLGATAFAEREGVDPGQLSWWKWRLKSRTPEHAAAIVPVRVVARREPVAVAEAPTASIEVALPSGARLRVGCGVDEETLVRVVRALESECS